MLSNPTSLSPICFALDRWFSERGTKHSVVWDIGVGWGKWGLLIKEILASRIAEAGDYTPENLSLSLVGVEMCKFFHTKSHLQHIYDHVIRKDFVTYSALPRIFSLYPPDLFLMFDVLEHLDPSQIDAMMRNLTNYLQPFSILVSVPSNVHMYTQPYYGEDCPKHKNAMTFIDYEDRYKKDFTCQRIHVSNNDIFWMHRKSL